MLRDEAKVSSHEVLLYYWFGVLRCCYIKNKIKEFVGGNISPRENTKSWTQNTEEL